MENSLSTPWMACWDQAWQAYCAQSVPIGAVVVDAAGSILSQGRNRSFENLSHIPSQIQHHPLAHAEVNALLALDFHNIDPHVHALYTLVEPCPLCIGAVCMAKIKTIYYASRDPWAGSTNLLQATPYLRKKRIKAIGPQEDAFETAILSLLTDFSLRYQEGYQKVLNAWRDLDPGKVSRAIAIYEAGALPDMKKRGLSPKLVLHELSKFVN